MSQIDQEHDQPRPPTRVQFPLDAGSYKILAEIGVGVSAVVYKALCVPLNSAPVAIKSIDLDKSYVTGDVIDNVRREAKIMSLLSHPNVLNAHCSFTVGRRLWVVMPFMSAGSVQSVIASAFPAGLPEPCIAVVLREILHALSYLHAQGHLHRDVKAGNVLVDGDGSVKLADFGVSASIHDGSPITDLAGTPYWMAPEVIRSHNGYGVKADIWSFGITALELAHGRPPLSHLPLSESLVLTITKRFRFSDYENCGGDATAKESSKRFSRAFKEMVGLCLNQEPSKRPSAEKLLKHSFFKNCKGSEFLVKNLLQGLPSVEERFNFLKTSISSEHDIMKKINGDDDDEDEDEDEDELKEKKRRISGWNFNEDVFELDPLFPTLSGELSDRPGQEPYNGGITDSEPTSPSQALESSEPTDKSSGGADSVLSSPGGIARERLLRDILNLRRNIDMERKTVAEILRLIGVAETETREEQLERAVEMARLELEIERRRNSELELENEFLKMQLQREE